MADVLVEASGARVEDRPIPGAGPPLFIIGSGRSGSTLVRKVLIASRQIYIPPETYEIGPIIETWPRMVLLRWREKVRLFCAFFEKHRHFETFNLPNLNDFAKEACLIPPRQRSLRTLIEAFYTYLGRINGATTGRWGDKTPHNTYHLRAIGRTFGDARFIWLARDGRDVALSYVEAGLYPDLAAAAERWVEANAACGAFARRRGGVPRVRYEDLATRPEDSFATLFAHAELTFRPEMLRAEVGPLGDVEHHAHHEKVLKPITAGSVGRWRSRLTKPDLAKLPPSFWRTLDALGYAR